MKLQSSKRTTDKKSVIKKIRREGNVPASIYVKGKDAEAITVKGPEVSAVLRTMLPGRLPTTVFTLVDENGTERKAIIKDIQYNVVNYQVIHLDFEELLDKVPVKVKVPIEFTGVADCVGVKLGGAIRQVIRHVKVRCLPKDIPTFFVLDVKELGQRQARRLGDIKMPKDVRALADLNEVAVTIVKR